MALKSLGYVGVESTKLDDWEGFATRFLGMQQVDAAAKVRTFRMDDRKQRLVVTGAEDDGLGFLGWEAESRTDLDELGARLDNAGVAVTRENRALADERRVAELISFKDPGGRRIEVFHGQEIAPDPFKPGRPISGFKTGPLGMGHGDERHHCRRSAPILPRSVGFPYHRLRPLALSIVLSAYQRSPS